METGEEGTGKEGTEALRHKGTEGEERPGDNGPLAPSPFPSLPNCLIASLPSPPPVFPFVPPCLSASVPSCHSSPYVACATPSAFTISTVALLLFSV